MSSLEIIPPPKGEDGLLETNNAGAEHYRLVPNWQLGQLLILTHSPRQSVPASPVLEKSG
jgi:hypothetical protein